MRRCLVMPSVQRSLADLLTGSPYQGYAYAYPHKTAYRPLEPATTWSEAWAGQERSALFLYAHVPFCTVRCGFCNLFAAQGPSEADVDRYLAALALQMRTVARALGPQARFARAALGGGTPTLLGPEQLERVLHDLRAHFGLDPAATPTSVETSPETASLERLRVLERSGVSRISIGVQSFDARECRALGRPQGPEQSHAALERIRSLRFATLNIDLIYGAEPQSAQSVRTSVRAALAYQPEELFLYPLYVRDLTGLGRRGERASDARSAMYRSARELLLDEGYAQVSMRMFRRRSGVRSDAAAPLYCCQKDGMVGLGAGARSYTSQLHYATEYAMAQPAVRSVVAEFCARDAARHAEITHGFRLDAGERRRRYVIQSLLQTEGLSESGYAACFGGDLWSEMPWLGELGELGLAARGDGVLRLTERGLEHSDVIGPWLASSAVQTAMGSYAWR